MQTKDFEGFYDRLIRRHQTSATHLLSTAGDAIVVGGIVVGAARRRRDIVVSSALTGFAVAAVAHLFQPGTLGEELREITRHPLWALRAEARRARSITPVMATE